MKTFFQAIAFFLRLCATIAIVIAVFHDDRVTQTYYLVVGICILLSAHDMDSMT